jgi:sialic acid synthase SpsE
MNIAGTPIDADHPAYVIAEIGVNHDGDPERALALVDSAADAGADAVKFQYFETDRLMGRAAKLAAYQQQAGETDPISMLRRLELPLDALAACCRRAHERGVHAIVSVFSVELVEPARAAAPWDALKAASPDTVNRPLLRAMAATGLPLIVSTGASTEREVVRARQWLDDASDRLAFLHCVSSYPTSDDDADLASCAHVAEIVRPCPVGYSDHTSGVHTGMLAVRHAGARLLEKHVTDDASRAGPDHTASLEPADLAAYVALAKRGTVDGAATSEGADAQTIARMLGDGEKRVLACERDVRRVSRQSLTMRRDARAGERLTRDMLTIKRPGDGLEPRRLDDVLGCALARDVACDMPLCADDVAMVRDDAERSA